jgi:hypothetical protein
LLERTWGFGLMLGLERIDRIQRSQAAKGVRILLIHSAQIRAFPLERIRRILC